MSLIDVIQTLSALTCLVAIAAWLLRLRRWPLTLAVVVAMVANIAFYLARTLSLLQPVDLNLFSSVRVLLMVLIIAALPATLCERTLL